jgi:galactokinase
MVDFVKNEPAVLGARMMGGGFGGCSINLVKEEAIEALSGRIEAAYSTAFGIEMKVYIATIENGTSIVATEKELVA